MTETSAQMGNIVEPITHNTENCTINAPVPIRGANLLLYILEMVICAAVLVSSALFAHILARTSTFSRTQKALFWNMLVSAFGITATRLFLLIPQTLANDSLYNQSFISKLQIFHDVSINVNTFIQIAITIECLMANKTLSQSLQMTVLVGHTTWPWIITIIFYALEYNGFIETVPQFVGWEAANLLSWIVFLRLYFVNRRKYKTMSAGNLDQKYKVTVNIRNLRTLLFLSALTSARNFITMTLLILILCYIVPHCLVDVKPFADHSYDISVALYSLLLIVPLILTHQEFRKNFKLLIFWHKSSSIDNVAAVSTVVNRHPSQPRNALGEALNMKQSGSEYHRQLALSWDVQAPISSQQVRPSMDESAMDRVLELLHVKKRKSNSLNLGHPNGTASLWLRKHSAMVDIEQPNGSHHHHFVDIATPHQPRRQSWNVGANSS